MGTRLKERYKSRFGNNGNGKGKVLNIGEMTRAEEGFVYYWRCGSTRTYKKVAEFMGVGESAVSGWAKKFDWGKRLLDMNQKFYDKQLNNSMERMIKETEKMKIEYGGLITDEIRSYFRDFKKRQKLAKGLKLELKSQFKKKKINLAEYNKQLRELKDLYVIRNVDDLEKLIKLQLLLCGESTERKESIITDEKRAIETSLKENPEAQRLVAELWRATGTESSTS